jgi:hypothetical protein
MSNDDIDSAAARAAEHYMRERYGASRGHPEWSALQDAFAAGYRAALAPGQADPEANPLARMWERLAAHQPFADKRGYGDAWKIMCEQRTQAAAEAAEDALLRVYDEAAASDPKWRNRAAARAMIAATWSSGAAARAVKHAEQAAAEARRAAWAAAEKQTAQAINQIQKSEL